MIARRKPSLHLVDRALPAHPSETAEDRAREERIAKLADELKRAMAAGAVPSAYRLQEEFKAAILARSPAQVLRMERAKGLRP